MTKCGRCYSYAINPHSSGRDGVSDLNLCDVCYWRKRAESLPAPATAAAETAMRERISRLEYLLRWAASDPNIDGKLKLQIREAIHQQS